MKVKSDSCSRFNGYCVEGQKKSSEVRQLSKTKLLEQLVKIFKEIPRKLTCNNSFCKVAARRALISMQRFYQREI